MRTQSNIHGVVSIRLERVDAASVGYPDTKWVRIFIQMEDESEIELACHECAKDSRIEVIDETQAKKPILTPDELQDIEDARVQVAALSCEAATLHTEAVRP